MRLFLLVCAILLAAPASAQDDEAMEVQRCIWRCLAEHGHGRAYERCVGARCNDAPAPKTRARARPEPKKTRRAEPAPRKPAGPQAAYGDWKRSPEPFPMYAACDGDLLCLMVSCRTKGRPSLELWATEHGRITGDWITLYLDDDAAPLRLEDEVAPDGHWRWPLNGTLATLLGRARTATVALDPGIRTGTEISLRGSGAAAEQILAACR